MASLNDLFGGAAPLAAKPLPCLPQIGRYPAARFKRTPAPPPKNGPRRVRVVDSFAGGGGASNGIELALELLKAAGLLPDGHSLYPDFAVNHDEPALAMHLANHPKTIHLPHNVWKVNMRDLLLTPRELARAQGFPDSYILAAPYKGKVLTETEQRHKIGNSVCRLPAAAFLFANYRPPLDWSAPECPSDEPFFLEAAE